MATTLKKLATIKPAKASKAPAKASKAPKLSKLIPSKATMEQLQAGSNYLACAHADILEALASAKKSSGDSLASFLAIGSTLVDVKQHFTSVKAPKGSYGQWVESNFGFDRSWSARLVKFFSEQATIKLAIAWCEAPGKRQFSVDGVLQILSEYLVAMDPAKAAKKAEADAKREAAKAKRDALKGGSSSEGDGDSEGGHGSSEAEALREALRQALGRIEALEQALAATKAQQASDGPAEALVVAPVSKPALKIKKITKASDLDIVALVEGVKRHALDNYNVNGWDYIVETMDDEEIAKEIQGCNTLKGAVAKVGQLAKLLDERRREVTAEIF